MTEIDGRATQRRGTWSSRGPWNRITYAALIGYFFWWFVLQQPNAWLVVPLAGIAWLLLSAHLVLIDRRQWDREHQTD